MKRVITIVQRKGMEGVLSHTGRAKHYGPDCAFCRHSCFDGKGGFVCELGKAIGTLCDRFRDARQALHSNYLKVQ